MRKINFLHWCFGNSHSFLSADDRFRVQHELLEYERERPLQSWEHLASDTYKVSPKRKRDAPGVKLFVPILHLGLTELPASPGWHARSEVPCNLQAETPYGPDRLEEMDV